MHQALIQNPPSQKFNIIFEAVGHAYISLLTHSERDLPYPKLDLYLGWADTRWYRRGVEPDLERLRAPRMGWRSEALV